MRSQQRESPSLTTVTFYDGSKGSSSGRNVSVSNTHADVTVMGTQRESGQLENLQIHIPHPDGAHEWTES
ncbi:hypothetical protein BSKO_05088 [Bryopsis sp. KO-2023]|nr:hypothetical protein BSKO_05088 [Bryopsis sp. KO-2023]